MGLLFEAPAAPRCNIAARTLHMTLLSLPVTSSIVNAPHKRANSVADFCRSSGYKLNHKNKTKNAINNL